MIVQRFCKTAVRYRNGLIVGGILLLLMAGWQCLEWLVNVDRYRPMVEEAIGKATGMPVRVGKLDLDLVPTPHLSAYATSLGTGDFRIAVRTIAVYPVWGSLLNKSYAIKEIALKGIVGYVPGDLKTGLERIQSLVSHVNGNSTGNAASDPSPVFLHRFVLRDATIYSGNQKDPWLQVSADIVEPLLESASAHVVAMMPEWGPSAQLTADISRGAGKSLTGEEKIPLMKGTVSLHQVECPSHLMENRLYGTTLDLEGTLLVTDLCHLALAVKGNTTCARVPMLAGVLAANVWWQEGGLTVNDLMWEGGGLCLRGDLTRNAEGTFACAIHEVTAGREALAHSAAEFSTDRWEIQVSDKATAALKDWLIGFNASDGAWRMVHGQGTLQGVNVIRRDVPSRPQVLSGGQITVTADENVLHVSQFEAEGIRLQGYVTPHFRTGTFDLDLSGTLALNPERLGFAGQAENLKQVNGTLELTRVWGHVENVHGGLIPELSAEAVLHDGQATILLPTTRKAINLNHVSGKFTYQQRTLTIEDFSGEGFGLTGRIALDDLTKRIHFTAQGSSEITRERLAAVAPVSLIDKPNGTLLLHGLEAEWEDGRFVPESFKCEGTVEKGAADIVLPEFTDTLNPVTGTFQATTAKVSWNIQAASRRLGPLHMEGDYTFARPADKKKAGTPGMIAGAVSGDVSGAILSFVPEKNKVSLGSMLSVYGASSFDVHASYGDKIVVDWTRRGKPSLTGSIVLATRDEHLDVERLEMDSVFPVAVLGSVIPVLGSNQGEAAFHFTREPASPFYVARVDFSDPELALGTTFRKRAGDPLWIEIKGNSSDWTPYSAALNYRNETIPARLENGRIVSEALDVELAGFSGLLPETGKAQGRIRGTFATSPASVVLQLDRAGLSFSPQVGLDAVTGEIKYADGRITCRNIKIVGANSDCTLTAGYRQDTLVGNVVGEKLDLNAIKAMWDAGKAFRSTPQTRPDTSPFKANLEVDLKALYYRRARFDTVHATVETEGDATHIRNISAVPYKGKVQGTIDLLPVRGTSAQTTNLNLQFEGAEARVIDELLFTEPREFTGTLTGMAAFQIPTGPDCDTLAATTGHAEFTGQHGSFGKIGLATRMLSFLKATEVFRLRFPSLKDEGLTYDTCQMSLNMDKGIMAMTQTSLRSPQFEMLGEGPLDFVGRQSNLKIRVNFLESVTGLLEAAPVIGRAMNAMGTAAGMELYVKGSVYSPEFQINPVKRIAEATKTVGEKAVQAGGGAASMGEKAVDALGNLLGGLKKK